MCDNDNHLNLEPIKFDEPRRCDYCYSYYESLYEVNFSSTHIIKMCKSCLSVIQKCEKCSKLCWNGDIIWTNKLVGFDDDRYDALCSTCVKDLEYVECNICKDYHIRDTMKRTSDGYLVCDNCTERTRKCCQCGRTILYPMFLNDYTYCVTCFDNLPGKIHSYDWIPPKHTFYRLAKEKKENKFYGIELEVELPDCDGRLSTLESANIDNEYFFFKEDGSLDSGGVEIVSMPATYNYIVNNFDLWDRVFFLKSMDAESFNTRTCGMHVHISRDSFSRFHLYKFIQFFYENVSFVHTLSGRPEISSYANFGSLDHKCLVEKVVYKNYCDKYDAINLSPRNTVEVRIFQGTLESNRFLSNLEFLESLYHYTNGIKTNQIDNMSSGNYKKYVYDKLDDYPHIGESLRVIDLRTYKREKMLKGKKKVSNFSYYGSRPLPPRRISSEVEPSSGGQSYVVSMPTSSDPVEQTYRREDL